MGPWTRNNPIQDSNVRFDPGLGLSISYDIVTQQHGGTIEVASELGAFTEFTVRLPRVRHMMTTEAAA